MASIANKKGEKRLKEYVERIGRVLGRRERREAFAIYATGLLGDCERKSIERIAAQACPEPEMCRAMTERLLNFVGESPWDDRGVRLCAARYGLESMIEREPVEAWILDDTAFIKKGEMSPGVQRQYTDSVGKVTNCQIGVSLTVATRTMELPVDMDLYLPESWAKDRKRCRAAHIPDSVVYRAKWQIALDLVERAVDAGYPQGLVLAGAGYGDVGEFRDGLRKHGLAYAVDVEKHTRVQVLGSDGLVSETMSVAMVADVIGARTYRRTTWREGTRRATSAKFAALRVRVVPEEGIDDTEQWLVIERSDSNAPPEHYVLSTLPKSLSRKALVRRFKQRWRIERSYEDMKGELGLNHFEGRSYRGWQHHVSTVLACYAFAVSERARAFSPKVGRSSVAARSPASNYVLLFVLSQLGSTVPLTALSC